MLMLGYLDAWNAVLTAISEVGRGDLVESLKIGNP